MAADGGIQMTTITSVHDRETFGQGVHELDELFAEWTAADEVAGWHGWESEQWNDAAAMALARYTAAKIYWTAGTDPKTGRRFFQVEGLK